MLDFTADQLKAQEELQIAIEKHSRAFRRSPDDHTPEILTDWILVACVVEFDGDERRVSYHMGFPGGQLEEHRAIGLCATAKSIILTPVEDS